MLFNSFPLKRNFYRPLMAMALMGMAASGIQAQENVSPWVGEPLPEQSGEYYLYNTAGDGFLIGANEWGQMLHWASPVCCVLLR